MPKIDPQLNEICNALCYVILDKHRDNIRAVLAQIDEEEALRDIVRGRVKRLFNK